MFTEAHVYDDTPIQSPLVHTNTVSRLLACLTTLDQQLPALTYYYQGEYQYSLNYGQFFCEVLCLRQRLQAMFHVQPGERIGVCCWNCPEVVLFDLAILSLGAILVPLNPEESFDFIHYVVEHSGLRLFVHNSALLERVQSFSLEKWGVHTQEIEALCTPSCASCSSLDLSELSAEMSHLTPALLLYTSGTTGRPKGVTLSHYNLLINAEALTRVHQLRLNRTHMCILPLFHANALGFSLITSYYAGIHLVLNDAFPAFSFWEIIRREQVNICSVVPEIVKTLSRHPRPVRRETLPHLRYLVSAAAPLAVEVARDFYEKTAIPLHQGYGLSENTNFATTLPYDITESEYKAVMHGHPTPSIGTELYGSSVCIVNAQGERVGPGISGEIVIQGHSNMSGYWQDATATQETLGKGYLRTGDQGYYLTYERGNYFFITGRFKEILLRSGQNISPLEVERELAFLEEIGDFAVVGFPHQHMGEEVGLYVSMSVVSPIVAQRFDSLAEVPFFKRPKVIVLGKMPVPRTNTGKIRRNLLKPYFHKYRNRIFSSDQTVIIEIGEEDAGNACKR